MKKTNMYVVLSLTVASVLGLGLFSAIDMQQPEIVMIGGSLPDYPLDFLAKNSVYAISGDVVELIPLPVQYDEVGVGDVFTDVVIDVRKDVHRKYTGDSITVRVLGGVVDNTEYIYEGAPKFDIGETVMILVADKEPESIYGDNYYVAGLQHGKYSIDEDGNAKNHDPEKNTSQKDLEDKIKIAKNSKTS